MCYLEIYDIPIPASAEIYIDNFIQLIEFKVLNPSGLIQSFGIDPDFSFDTLISGIDPDGVMTESVINNLRIFILVFIFTIIVIFVMICCCIKCEKCKSKIKKKL